MASDIATAAWHPAMMPNSVSDMVANDTPRADSRELPSSSLQTTDAPEISPKSYPAQVHDVPTAGKSVLDEWSAEEDTGESWLKQQDVPMADSDIVGNALEREEGEAEDDADATSTAAKHSSTVSFARTVSHDVNWDVDDEDADWNLSRTDTDPFKFMPPSDRTNSFPVVPPAEHPHDHYEEHPLPSSQAEDVMNELDHEELVNLDESASFLDEHTDTLPDARDLKDSHAPQQYIGGELQGPDEEASEARYAEGFPLIQHGDEVSDAVVDTETPKHDLVGGEVLGENDDFFGDIGNNEQPGSPISAMERKSTIQVMSALGANSKETLHQCTEKISNEDVATDEKELETPPTEKQDSGEDLAVKWSQVFAEEDDGDMLLDDSAAESKELDPAAFFEDDDEGFLEDTGEEYATGLASVAAPESKGLNGQYIPSQEPQASSNHYLPTSMNQPVVPAPFTAPTLASSPPASLYGAPRPQLESARVESFVDKGKAGYQSPYDLPMDLVKQPRKRHSMQQIPRAGPTPSSPMVPPRSASVYGQAPPPSRGSAASLSPPPSSDGQQAQTGFKPPPISSKPRESFFEELPISSRVRPSSRQSHKSLPSPSQTSPYGPPQVGPPQASPLGQQLLTPPPTASPPQQQYSSGQATSSDATRLIAPERVNPYAPLHSDAPSLPAMPAAPINSRYSPAPPPIATGAPPSAASSRYSPALSRSSSGGYGGATSPLPPMLPHQPRTSSPLAHFELTYDKAKLSPSPMADVPHGDRRSSSSMFEPRLNRVPSLPPTREVDEEDATSPTTTAAGLGYQAMASPEVKPIQPYRPRQTPPPQAVLSPPKRSSSNYAPLSIAASPQQHVPPPRSQTQSPGSLHGRNYVVQSPEAARRPSSVHSNTVPTQTASPYTPLVTLAAAPQSRSSRPRGISQSLNLVPPTDGRQLDPLQRWKGAPLISWGVGGVIVTSFPKDVPRYGMNQAIPQVVRSPGAVKIQSVKEVQPLEDRLAKFPGPLKGKSKKKETITWLSTGIETLEKSLPNPSFQSTVLLEEKRAIERVLLWKMLRLFIEYDGALEGSPAVDKAVRDVLAPGIDTQINPAETALGAAAPPASGLQISTATGMRSDGVEPSAMEHIRLSLLGGDREAAAWAAADKRLWGHALLIANTFSQDLYRKVAQEFVRNEVNHPGHNNESLAALYEVLSGNYDECVDELVPVHARAGLQLMSTSATSSSSRDELDGLDKWRETLCLVLSNRSSGDPRALNALGTLLSGYGRAEAAHICFLFARNATVFGGLDDPLSNFVLIGSDHKRQSEQFAKETEALLLSEVYEYGLTLSSTSNVALSSPHLAAYKLQHAQTLAEYGYRDKALQYCEAITGAITAQTKRSPYYHVILEASVEDLATRLKQAPKEGSNSWISKPSMNKVSNSVWDRFNKFVAGDESDGSTPGVPDVNNASGPFAHLSGGTPTISRPPSSAGVTGMDMFGGQPTPLPASSNQSLSPPTTRASSRYAPSATKPSSTAGGPYEYTTHGAAPMSGNSYGEVRRGSSEYLSQAAGQPPMTGNPYAPTPAQNIPDHGLGISHESPHSPNSQTDSPIFAPVQPPIVSAPQEYPAYAPVQASESPYAPVPSPSFVPQNDASVNETQHNGLSGYQPPSYGYEPPSLSSYEPPSTQQSGETANTRYEAPSYQPYGYEPPSYEPDSDPASDEELKSKKKSFMDDDGGDDDIPALREQNPQDKSKSEKDRENEELVRRIAEEEAKREAEQKAAKKAAGWGFGGWFGGAKKEQSLEGSPNKPIRAKLGEASSFYYDPELKRWINKKGGAEDNAPKTATPPPPRAGPRSAASTPPPPSATPEPGRASAPPPRSLNLTGSVPDLISLSRDHLPLPPGAPPLTMRSVSSASAITGGPPSGPPSRPTTSMSNASSIDDLLGAPAPRKAGARKTKKSGRYIDVMAK